MKKSFLKELLWIAGGSLGLLILLFSFTSGKSLPCGQASCCKAAPSAGEIAPVWESIFRQFVSTISIY